MRMHTAKLVYMECLGHSSVHVSSSGGSSLPSRAKYQRESPTCTRGRAAPSSGLPTKLARPKSVVRILELESTNSGTREPRRRGRRRRRPGTFANQYSLDPIAVHVLFQTNPWSLPVSRCARSFSNSNNRTWPTVISETTLP